MALVGRWLLTVAVCFLLFPVVFILWHGPDNQFGYVGGAMLMFFLQFASPYAFWKIPLAVGTVLGVGWHIVVRLRSSEHASKPPFR